MKQSMMILAAAFLGGALSGQSPDFRVTLLGTAGPSMSTDRAESGTLVQAGSETLLFDCGRGVPERLNQLGVGAVTKVFLTHLHSDHTQGLPVLWMGQWNGRGTTNLSLWGPGPDTDQPTGTAGLAANLTTAYATNTHIRRDLVEMWSGQAITFDVHEIQEGVVYQSNGVTVTAFQVDHAPVRPAFGYRIDYAGHSVVISGDTRPSDNLVKFAKGVNVLIHEVFNALPGATAATAAYHTIPEQAADVFTRVAPGLAVYSHMAPNAFDPTARTRAAGYSGPLLVGSDLTTITIGDKVTATTCDSPGTPVVSAVTNEKYGPELSAGGFVIVWGSWFTSRGGNALNFSRAAAGPGAGPGQGPGAAAPIVLDATSGPSFWDLSSTQINAALGDRVAAGQWTVSVKNACGVTSAAFAVTVQ